MSRAEEWVEYIVNGGPKPEITDSWPIVPPVEL